MISLFSIPQLRTSVALIIGLMLSWRLGSMIVQGQHWIAVLPVLAVVLALIYPNYPEFLVMLVVFLSTNNLELAPVHKLPSFPFFPGMILSLQDMLLVFLFVTALPKIAAREERPIFLKPFLVMSSAIVIGFLVNIAFHNPGLDRTGRIAREYFAYGFYLVVVAHIDSEHRLNRLIRFLLTLLIVSVGLQIVETATGQRIVAWGTGYFARDTVISVGTMPVLYAWNRTGPYVLFLAMLPIALALTTGKRRYMALAIIGLLAIILGFVRSWYVMTIVALMVLYLCQLGGRKVNNARLVFLLIAVFAALGLIGAVSTQWGGTIGTAPRLFLARLASGTIDIEQSSTFLGRAEKTRYQLELIARSPIYGKGPLLGGQSLDIGVVNTWVALGGIGVVAAIYWIGTFLYYAIRLLKKGGTILDSRTRATLMALVAAWSGMMVGYVFSWDFFATRDDGIFVVGVMSAILDRLWVWRSRHLLSNKQAEISS